jgi:hypothetical protein
MWANLHRIGELSMYGKHFACTYTGSMVGSGVHVFAVWGYVIAHTVKGRIEINPAILASILGCDISIVNSAIEYLCRPDPESRNTEYEGKRLIKEGQYLYFVPSHERYYKIANEEERREYLRKKKVESRSRKNVNTSQHESTMSTQAEAEAESRSNKTNNIVQKKTLDDEGFNLFWKNYPRKEGKTNCIHWWRKNKPPKELLTKMLKTLEWQVVSEQWTKEGGKFRPMPLTWLNGGRWDDEPPADNKPKDDNLVERAVKLGLIPESEVKNGQANSNIVAK